MSGYDKSELLRRWNRFYERHFGMSYDFSGIIIPEKPKIKSRLLVISDQLIEELCAKIESFVECIRYVNGDLDELFSWHKRSAKKNGGPYAIWVAEEDAIDKRGCVDLSTVHERLLYELVLLEETGRGSGNMHCYPQCGSRSADGKVGNVHHFGNKVCIDLVPFDNCCGNNLCGPSS